MNTGHKPKIPKCPLGAIQPNTMDTEAIKRDAWRNDGILVLSRHDVRLSWTEAQELKNLGDRLYGNRRKD